MKHNIDNTTWAYPYKVSTVKADFVAHGLPAPTDEECIEICEAINLKIDDEFFDWAVEIYKALKED